MSNYQNEMELAFLGRSSNLFHSDVSENEAELHEALNSSDENRFHFIIHGGSNKERKILMRKSLVKQFGSDVLREIND